MEESRATCFCIDIETNGPVPGLYDMVSLGIVAVYPDSDKQLKTGATLYIEFRPEAENIDDEALEILNPQCANNCVNRNCHQAPPE